MKKILLIFFLIISQINCAGIPFVHKVSSHECIKDGKRYCVVDGNFNENFNNYYERGISCMEGGCYSEAISDFKAAIRISEKDRRKARPYGLHFIDYFPHREKGLVHLLTGDYQNAKIELEKSIQQCPSEKAYTYLDDVRKIFMNQTKKAIGFPLLSLYSPSFAGEQDIFWTNKNWLTISGIAKDRDQFVSKIWMNQAPIFLESSQKQVSFEITTELEDGLHDLEITAQNLMGGETTIKRTIGVDTNNPIISILSFENDGSINGLLFDESGEIKLYVNNIFIQQFDKTNPMFQIPLKTLHFQLPVEITAIDRLGNQSKITVDHRHNIFFAQNMHTNASDIESPVWLSQKADSIVLIGVKNEETVYVEKIYIQGIVESRAGISILMINDNILKHAIGKMTAFCEPFQLKTGQNIIHIVAIDTNGKKISKKVTITQKQPGVFLLKNRLCMEIHQLIQSEYNDKSIWFQHWFAKDIFDKKRFQIVLNDGLKTLILDNGFSTIIPEVAQSVQYFIAGDIYDSRYGFEVAMRITNPETSQLVATIDVYSKSETSQCISDLARRLSMKLHHCFPFVDYRIMQQNTIGFILKPEKWIFPKRRIIDEKICSNVPAIVYRNTHIDSKYGSGNLILDQASLNPKKRFAKIKPKKYTIQQTTDRIVTQ
jgi:tetratricopeptide (TPR) repeat protein